jgi:ATP-dependent DNA helicase PIF1
VLQLYNVRRENISFAVQDTAENDDGFCTFTIQSGTGKLLQSSSLIIWDEASMTKRHAVEALDNSMRDIMSRPDLPFDGKTVVFGRYFR